MPQARQCNHNPSRLAALHLQQLFKPPLRRRYRRSCPQEHHKFYWESKSVSKLAWKERKLQQPRWSTWAQDDRAHASRRASSAAASQVQYGPLLHSQLRKDRLPDMITTMEHHFSNTFCKSSRTSYCFVRS